MTKSAQVLALLREAEQPLSIGRIADALGWTDDDTKTVMLHLRKTGKATRANEPVVATYRMAEKEVTPTQIIQTRSDRLVDLAIRTQPNSVFALGGSV